LHHRHTQSNDRVVPMLMGGTILGLPPLDF